MGIPDVRNAYVQTILDNGKRMGQGPAQRAAELTGGFPYMVQLLGHYLWRSSETCHSQIIEDEDVDRAFPDAIRAFEDAVCAPAFRGLTKAQWRFVLALREAGGSNVAMAEVATRAEM